jgi:hypothetical protein
MKNDRRLTEPSVPNLALCQGQRGWACSLSLSRNCLRIALQIQYQGKSCQRSVLTLNCQQGGQTLAKEPQKPHPVSPLPRFVVLCYTDMSRPWLDSMADLKYIRRCEICFRNI